MVLQRYENMHNDFTFKTAIQLLKAQGYDPPAQRGGLIMLAIGAKGSYMQTNCFVDLSNEVRKVFSSTALLRT
jgi:hypothetical protein